MKAVILDTHGGPEVLRLAELPDPVPQKDEVVVDIHAASLNGADWKVRVGGHGYKLTRIPYVLGRDFSGIVSAVGEGVTDFRVGDATFGVLDVGHEGTYCEKVATKAAIIAAKPDAMSHVEAAALALIGITAVVSIEHTLKLRKGETILIQGGAGGVAGFGIGLARHLGARVISTTSTPNVDYVESLGADQVIDYRKEDFTKVLAGVDAVFDTVGGEVTEQSFRVVRPGGRVACIASGHAAPPSPRPDVASLRPAVGRNRPQLDRVVELWQAGAVRVPEVRLFTLDQAVEATRVSEQRRLRGKLVLKVR